LERLQQESNDPTVAVLLLDVILGYNAHPNPAALFAPAIRRARERAAAAERALPVVVHICGTDHDPQNLEEQRAQLGAAGAITFSSNVEAAYAAAWIASRDGRFG
jgi:dihydroorotase-like cyclic amidohydrolase